MHTLCQRDRSSTPWCIASYVYTRTGGLVASLVVEASADGCDDCLVLLAAYHLTGLGVGVATDNIWALQRKNTISTGEGEKAYHRA